MQRRRFLTSSLAAPALALDARLSNAQSNETESLTKGREFYELRSYHLISGPQQKLADSFLAEALVPALNRLNLKPIGVFDLYLGPETPTTYVLVPGASLEALVTAELKLAEDEEYQRSGHLFLHAPAAEPPYERMQSALMIAFSGHPTLTLPPVTAQHGSRVFQLRTYESPNSADHQRKVEMFNSGEYAIFEKAGFWQVFYGDTVIGPRMPNLTYMLGFPDLSELNAKWKAFGSDPDWKKLSTSPKFSYEAIVSNITNLILNPKPYSQI
jgi:hypothetical protein